MMNSRTFFRWITATNSSGPSRMCSMWDERWEPEIWDPSGDLITTPWHFWIPGSILDGNHFHSHRNWPRTQKVNNLSIHVKGSWLCYMTRLQLQIAESWGLRIWIIIIEYYTYMRSFDNHRLVIINDYYSSIVHVLRFAKLRKVNESMILPSSGPSSPQRPDIVSDMLSDIL